LEIEPESITARTKGKRSHQPGKFFWPYAFFSEPTIARLPPVNGGWIIWSGSKIPKPVNELRSIRFTKRIEIAVSGQGANRNDLLFRHRVVEYVEIKQGKENVFFL